MQRIMPWALVCAAVLVQSAAAQAPLPISAFASLPQLEPPQLSPDGEHLAFVQSVNGRPAAVIIPVDQASGEKPRIIPSDTWIVEDVEWAKNDTVVLTARNDFHNSYAGRAEAVQRRAAVKLDGSPMVMLLNNQKGGYYMASAMVDKALDDNDSVFMPSLTLANQRVLATLVKVNVRTGKGVIQRADNGQDTQHWIMDGKGNVAARIDVTHNPLTAHLLVKHDDTWTDVWSRLTDYDDGGFQAGLTEDGKFILLQIRENGEPRILKFDVANPANPQTVYDEGQNDAGLIFEPWTNRVVGTHYYDDGIERPFFFSPDISVMWLELGQTFANKRFTVFSMSRAHDKIVVGVRDTVSSPPSYYLVDRTARKATHLGDAYPLLVAGTLGQQRRISYTARDGLTIPAYLTLPPGKTAKSLPLIVMPHGGPEARDTPGFDWWAQFMANRGYAVLQPQYRGSTGMGRKFIEAGFKQWGRKMQDDITDGVNKLVADGTADPKRVCIVGASYGGYAALAGAALTPDLYACAISFAGISDLHKLVAAAREDYGLDSNSAKYRESRIGNPFTDRQKLEDTSPAMQAAKVRAPILLIHGANDFTVPVEQSDEMNAALVAAGKTVRYIKLPGEDHYMSDADTRMRVLQETEAFLGQHIGN